MNCPNCIETSLVMTDRQGVEIDHCSQCRGVWLDRGELDKLVARAAVKTVAVRQSRAHRYDSVELDHRGSAGRHNGRRKSWLADIFD